MTSTLTLDVNATEWKPFLTDTEQLSDAYPDSVCSRPCPAKQYYQQRELVCCWDCIPCRNNEILNGEMTGCELCPLLTWPDAETAKVCEPIKPE